MRVGTRARARRLLPPTPPTHPPPTDPPPPHGRRGTRRASRLQQVVLHDVTYHAVLVKVASAPLDAKVLLEDDLHALDVLPVPDGLEADVGEAQHEEVHHELLAQVVIDPVELLPRGGCVRESVRAKRGLW